MKSLLPAACAHAARNSALTRTSTEPPHPLCIGAEFIQSYSTQSGTTQWCAVQPQSLKRKSCYCIDVEGSNRGCR